MENKKFLRYCPNCTHYDQSAGACNYINENVLEYPSKFIKYCDGKYLSLIKGRDIGPEIEDETHPDDEYIIDDMVTVFAQNNFALFQIAKTLLKDRGIKFWSNGEYMGPTLGRPGYDVLIKVFREDETDAREILNELQATEPNVPLNITDQKIKYFVSQWGIAIIMVIFILIVILYFVFKKD